MEQMSKERFAKIEAEYMSLTTRITSLEHFLGGYDDLEISLDEDLGLLDSQLKAMELYRSILAARMNRDSIKREMKEHRECDVNVTLKRMKAEFEADIAAGTCIPKQAVVADGKGNLTTKAGNTRRKIVGKRKAAK